MKPFRAGANGTVIATIDRDEALLLQNLASQVTSLLGDPDGADPALARLLPDAYPDDAAASAEFRHFTFGGLVEGKRENAHTVITTLSAGIERGELLLDAQQAAAWLRSLTDIRLTLAARLGIVSEDQPAGDDILRELYDWLGFIQNSLVEAVDQEPQSR